MPKTVGVAVSNATFHFDKLYTYAVMPDQQDTVRLGSMVLVPFGRGSRARMGVVLACDAEPESAKLKFLFDVAPASACLTPELLRLVHFLKERTFCTYYEAVKAVIPYGAQYKPTVAEDGVTPVLQKQLVRHTENAYKLVGTLPPKPRPTAKQLAAVALLAGGERTLSALEEKGISRAVLDNLCAKGVLECSKVNKSIDLYSSIPLKNEPILLTEEQQAAYDALLPGLEDAAPHSALLYGVTGSGKTLVFLKLIEHCLQMGRRALVLVPEISLTPQMILRLKSQFGKRVAVQHSALNHTERLLQWQMIQDGGADIVVGTRSAIFSPLENIGLVIIDEEQEHTYRSESAPRYSAHEVARQRAAENGALLLLASATPSTESYYAAQHGRTQLVRLTKRYGGNPLPKVQIVDMRAELASGNPREISLAMEDAIRRNLDAGKQTILLLNRRGYQTMAQCDDCREVLKCPKCSVPMVYHKAGHKLLCHYCGTQLDPPPKTCPACGGKRLRRESLAVTVGDLSISDYCEKSVVDALDFVLKPVSYYQFSTKLERALQRIQRRRGGQVALQVSGGVQLLDTDDILYLETRDRLLHYHTATDTWSVRGSLLKAEKDLAAYHFARCNQCYLVNLRHVRGVQDDLVQVGEERLEISRRQRTAFLAALAAYVGGAL